MKVNAISLNDTSYFKGDDKDHIKEIRTVYAYDPEKRIHLCELIPSHELRYLYTYIVWEGEPSEDKRDELEERYCYEDNEGTYMHVSDVRQFVKDNPTHAKECGDYDDMEEACEYLNGNWPL